MGSFMDIKYSRHSLCGDGGPLSVTDSPRDSRRRGPQTASQAPLAVNLWVSRRHSEVSKARRFAA